MKNPRVSIIIPVYNGANYMAQAIDSALNQTYSNIEIIVVNDGSKDNGATEKIALNYESKIVYIRKENGGVASALNYGIRNMTGDIFCWLSHDDVYMPDKIEKQIKFHLSFNEPLGFISYHDYYNINDKNEVISRRDVERDDRDIFKLLTYKFPLNFCSVFLPKKIIEDVGLFDENNPVWADHKMLVDVAAKYPFKYMSGIFTKIRRHGNQVTNTNSLMKKYSNDSLIYGLEVYLKNNSEITVKEKMALLKTIIKDTSIRGYIQAAENSLHQIKEISYLQYIRYRIISQFNYMLKRLRKSLRNSIFFRFKNSH